MDPALAGDGEAVMPIFNGPGDRAQYQTRHACRIWRDRPGSVGAPLWIRRRAASWWPARRCTWRGVGIDCERKLGSVDRGGRQTDVWPSCRPMQARFGDALCVM